MLFSSTLILALASAVTCQNASAYAAGLLATLTAANLTTLLSIAEANAAVLLPLLATGNHTLFAPTDAAFAALPAATLNNTPAVLQLVSYHLVNGGFPFSALAVNTHTVATTSLTANLPGNQTQAIVLAAGPANSSVVVIGGTSNVTSIGSTVYANLNIHIIDTLLTVPVNTSTTAVAAGLTSLVGALTMYAPTAIPVVDGNKGITVFAPVNSAFAVAAAIVGTLNTTQISNVLLNHVITGVTAYSTSLSNSLTATSASGEPLSFIVNATGAYVVSGPVVAKIIRSDVIVANGVVHVIDSILANANSSSAPSGATAAATTAGTSTATATGTTGSASATAKSSASSLSAGAFLTGASALFAVFLL